MGVGAIDAHGAMPAAGTPQPRLMRAAHEFEAQMMKELLKPLTASDSLTGEGEDTGSGGALAEFASESLGRALSERGGLGIADRIVQSFSHPGNDARSAKAARNVHGNTTS